MTTTLTPKRRAALETIAAGGVHEDRRRWRTADGNPVDREAVRWLMDRRLVTLGTFDRLVLTEDGSAVLNDARESEEFAALPRETLLDLGAQVMHRYGPRPPGRNVVCRTCGRTGPHTPVWFTNESGRVAERDARRVLRDHVLAHVRGTLPPT